MPGIVLMAKPSRRGLHTRFVGYSEKEYPKTPVPWATSFSKDQRSPRIPAKDPRPPSPQPPKPKISIDPKASQKPLSMDNPPKYKLPSTDWEPAKPTLRPEFSPDELLRHALNYMGVEDMTTRRNFKHELGCIEDEIVEGFPRDNVECDQELYDQVRALLSVHRRHIAFDEEGRTFGSKKLEETDREAFFSAVKKPHQSHPHQKSGSTGNWDQAPEDAGSGGRKTQAQPSRSTAQGTATHSLKKSRSGLSSSSRRAANTGGSDSDDASDDPSRRRPSRKDSPPTPPKRANRERRPASASSSDTDTDDGEAEQPSTPPWLPRPTHRPGRVPARDRSAPWKELWWADRGPDFEFGETIFAAGWEGVLIQRDLGRDPRTGKTPELPKPTELPWRSRFFLPDVTAWRARRDGEFERKGVYDLTHLGDEKCGEFELFEDCNLPSQPFFTDEEGERLEKEGVKLSKTSLKRRGEGLEKGGPSKTQRTGDVSDDPIEIEGEEDESETDLNGDEEDPWNE